MRRALSFENSPSFAAMLLLVGTLAVSTSCVGTGQPMASPTLEVYAEITNTRPGNVAVTPSGRVIVTNHPLDNPALRVVEVRPDGSTRPFPNLDWADGPEKGAVGIASTIGIASDTKGVVWILDMGGESSPPQIVAWDTRTDRLHQQLTIPSHALAPTSFLQDFALDEKRRRITIADMTFPPPGAPAQPAFVVVDLDTGECRRVLEGSDALMPVAQDVVIDGSLVAPPSESGTPTPHHLGVNPIAIDPSFEWVYFGTINGSDVFRMPAAALADASLGDDQLAATITVYGEKRPSDGIAVDGHGRVFITDIRASAVGVTTPTGYTIVAQDDVLLCWPDGFAWGPDGSLYVTQNQLHAHPGLNEGQDETKKPFHIVRLRW